MGWEQLQGSRGVGAERSMHAHIEECIDADVIGLQPAGTVRRGAERPTACMREAPGARVRALGGNGRVLAREHALGRGLQLHARAHGPQWAE